MATTNYQDLRVWQASMDLAEGVYKICKQLPKTELYGLCDQMKRAAVSIPSNIAEGQKRLNYKETIQFSGVALGSCAELETQLLLSKRLFQIDVEKELLQSVVVARMLTALIVSLRSKIQVPRSAGKVHTN